MGIKHFLAAAALAAVTAAPAPGQEDGVLRGTVKAQSGEPMPGVVVTVAHPDDLKVRVAITDTRGEYEVGGLEAGTEYAVSLSHSGYRKLRMRARATPGDASLQVELKPRRTGTQTVR